MTDAVCSKVIREFVFSLSILYSRIVNGTKIHRECRVQFVLLQFSLSKFGKSPCLSLFLHNTLSKLDKILKSIYCSFNFIYLFQNIRNVTRSVLFITPPVTDTRVTREQKVLTKSVRKYCPSTFKIF